MSANPSRCFVPIGQWADGWFRRRTASRRCRGRNESALNMITHDQIIDDSELGTVVVRETGLGQFQQEVISESHRLFADQPVSVGGLDSAQVALGACTSVTLRLYADRGNFL